MNFITNTKPLSDALNLGVINSNVSVFHKKSTIVQLTATRDTLRINIEASLIKTEITLRGEGDEDGPITIFIGSLTFKNLLSTIDSNTVTLEFDEGGVILHSGKSKFTLPKLIDATEMELDAPEPISEEILLENLDKTSWKYIKDNQMYALSMSFIHPVYTRVWLGDSGDVIVGDFDNSLFTHSVQKALGTTCLVSDTIINLFISLPDGSQIGKINRDYIIVYNSDSFKYRTQFTPLYEDDENVGDYNSQIFLGLMKHPDNFVSLNAEKITKFISQSELLSVSNEDTITFSINNNLLSLKDKNIDCQIDVISSEPYSVEFKTTFLKRVLSNYGDCEIKIAPLYMDGVIGGIQVWNDSLTTILAGIE